MMKNLKVKYDLSSHGYSLVKQGVFYNVLANISKMLPVGLCTWVMASMLNIINTKSSDVLPSISYVMIGFIVIFLMFLFSYIEYSKTYVEIYKESANRRIGIAEHLRKLPLSFFAKRDLSDLTTTIMADSAGIEHALSHAIPQVYGSIIFTIIICVALSILNWKLALSLFWVIPIALVIIFFAKNLQFSLGKAFKKEKLKTSNSIQTSLEMIQEIKSFGLEEEYKEVLTNQLDDFEESQRKSELFTATMLASAQMVLKLGLVTVIIKGSSMVLNGEINLYTYILFLFSSGLVYDPIYGVMSNLTEIFSTDILVGRFKKIYNENIYDGIKEINLSGYNISFKNVSFGYKDDSEIIKDLSFTAKEGEKTAIVGPSGSGKSTILKLTSRFYDVSKGEIYLENQNISVIDAEKLLQYYSVVFQEVLLFDNTIMENIRIGNKDATDEEVIRAAEIANCDNFIKDLPNGYNTFIGENGKLLSGGEKQRISIARAILKNAPVVLLDEVTASLDIENEHSIQAALDYVIKDKTVLIIAHKLSTVENCDKIIVLNKGNKEEEGTHLELLKKGGLYSKLYEMQTCEKNRHEHN